MMKVLVEKREDFQLVSRLNLENKELRSTMNKLRLRETKYRKIIEEFKQKGKLKRTKDRKNDKRKWIE